MIGAPTPSQSKLFLDEGPSPRFNPFRTKVPPAFSFDSAFGDVDGDGAVDMVYGGGKVVCPQLTVAVNDGAGDFIPSPFPRPPRQITGAGLHSTLKLADLDSDGDLDLIASGLSIPLPGKKGVVIWENDGKGRFLLPTKMKVPAISNCGSLAVGDIDGDGDIDIVAAPDLKTKIILANNGKGVFAISNALAGGLIKGAVLAMALGDLNRDGKLDIVFAHSLQPGTLWLSGTNGTYTHTLTLPLIYSPHMADLDGDGFVELIVADRNARRAVIYQATKKGTLRRVVSIPTQQEVVPGDFDQDGDLDLIVRVSMRLFENRDKFQFVDVTKSLLEHPGPFPSAAAHVTVVDVDNDGDVDLVGLARGRDTASKGEYEAPVIFRNRRRHLTGPRQVGIGKLLSVTTNADDQHLFTLGLAANEVSIPLGSLGTLRLDPTAMVLSSRVTVNRIPQTWSLQVPNDANLVGLTVRFQGLDRPLRGNGQARFTRLLRVEVTK